MRPRADFVCLNKSCVEGDPPAQVVYELPVDASHCPKGHKRLKRLFNRVAVVGTRSIEPDRDWRVTSTSNIHRSEALLQESYDHHLKHTNVSADFASRTLVPGDSEREINMPQQRKFVMPKREEVAAAMGLGGKGYAMSEFEQRRAAAMDPYSLPAMLRRHQGKLPTVVAGRGDT